MRNFPLASLSLTPENKTIYEVVAAVLDLNMCGTVINLHFALVLQGKSKEYEIIMIHWPITQFGNKCVEKEHAFPKESLKQ